jgi:cysteine synthase
MRNLRGIAGPVDVIAQDGSPYPLGISDECGPAILQLDDLDPVIAACDGDCILMAQKLAAELGIAVGISSGAKLSGRRAGARRTW